MNLKESCCNNMDQSRHLVFVYGTLKRNEPNHEKYMKKVPEAANNLFIGSAELIGKLPLVVASRHNVSNQL